MGYINLTFGASLDFKTIHISKLIVNPNNDRHEPTGSEEAAINWLFEKKPKQMKRLASNIATAGRVFDSPLVVRDGVKYLVKDGNRRVTCVKLIHSPQSAPERYISFFEALRATCSERLSNEIVCQVEDDLTIVESIVETRHNGSQDGEGQLPWGTREKARHANRVSGKSDYAWSQRIENFLTKGGYKDEALSIKRSTLDRLLGAKRDRDRFGLSEGKDGELESRQTDKKTTRMLLALVDDMKTNRLTLNELLKAKNKAAYIDTLASKGLLAEEHKPDTGDRRTKKKPRGPNPTKRTTVIPRAINFDFQWAEEQSKIHEAWEQLQFHLDINKHKFSISVVLRVLIELTAQNYQNKNSIPNQNKLTRNLKLVSEHLRDRGLLESETYRDSLRIIDGSTKTDSIESLQRVLHSKSHMPSNDDLFSLWDCLNPLLIASIKSCQKTKL